MKRLNRALLFGVMGLLIITVACGGGAAEETPAEGAEAAPVAAPVDPAARAAADRLVARLANADITLVPTQRGTAQITYMQPVASRESNFIVTTIRVKNVAENAIAGFQVDEFWFDVDGNTVTGDQVRFRAPMLVGEVRDIELRVPRVPSMDRSNYEFSHQNGDIVATLLDEIEAPPEPEEEEEEEGGESDGV